jgi:hypothetical protein
VQYFFCDNNALCTIDRIEFGTAFCSYLNNESHAFRLSLDAVAPLIAGFGGGH